MTNLSSQVSGPVDLAQLQLENTELLEILQSKNRKVSNSHNYFNCSYVNENSLTTLTISYFVCLEYSRL